jgi:RNA polymerase sigma-70 factor (ECF subfamily)
VAAEAPVSEQGIAGNLDFDVFVATEFTSILALALALLRNRDDALDVAQETMARALARWDDVAALDRPGAWARRVALNLVTDTQRRRTRRRRLQLRLRAQPASISPTPESDRWDREFWTEVAALPQRQRDAVTLHYVEDLPIAEIASILEAPAGTIKSDLSRARDHLRIAITESDA